MDTRISTHRASAYVSLLSIFALLSACGGGGGGGSSAGSAGGGSTNPNNPPDGSSPPTPARVEAMPAAVTVNAAVNEPRPESVVVNATFFNLPDEQLYLAYGHSELGINTAFFTFTSETNVMVTVTFKPPLEAALGAHSDVLVMQMCRDTECASIVPGTEVLIPVTYTVTRPALGSGPVVTFERTAYSATGTIEDLWGGPSGPRELFVPMQFSRFGENTPQVSVIHSENALLAGANVSLGGENTGLTLRVDTVNNLGLGTFHDTITVEVCADVQCVYPAEGSPYTLTFDYTISNTVTVDGPDGYTWTAVDFDPTAFVWNHASERILATRTLIPDGQIESNDGRLASIDPIDATVDWEIELGAMAHRLAVSHDGQFAYVVVGTGTHEIRKIRISDQSTIATFALPSTNMVVNGLDVAPGAPDTLAVIAADGAVDAMLLFDSDGLVDQYDLSGDLMSGTFGADAFSFYAYDARADLLHTFDLSASALSDPTTQPVDLNGTHVHWSDIRYDGGLLFENHGAVYDPTAAQLVTTLPLGSDSLGPDSSIVAPATDFGRAFYWYLDSGSQQLHAFDLEASEPISRIVTGSRTTFELIRWGTDGLAFVNSGQTRRLILLRGNFVRPAHELAGE